MSTLYRKYRPQNFEEVVNQNHIKITLQNEIQSGKIAHAYLFCGPRAVGKTTLARVFSKSINCTNRKEGEYEPCCECESCTGISSNRNIDLIEIDAASNTGVDNVRDNIISSARIAPSKNKYKVFIIDEVHMLSISAFNALLKIMEEPPSNVVFILCTTEVHKVPTTIISRCQRFDFKKISVNDIADKLVKISKNEGVKIDKKILESIARHSGGHMRDAESLLSQVISVGGKEVSQEEADLIIPRSDISEIISMIKVLANKDTSKGIEITNKLVDEGVSLKDFLTDFLEILRKVMIGKVNPSLNTKLALDLGESLELKLEEATKEISINQLVLFINKFTEARNKMKNSFIIQLPVELAIIEICETSSRPQTSTTNSFQSPPQNPSQNLSKPAKHVPNINSTSINGKINKDQILQNWNEVLVKIKKHNHSLSFILKACEPREVSGNQVCLAFKYKFHKDRVSDPQIKNMIEGVFKEVFGENLILEAIVDESLEINGDTKSENLNNENIDNQNFDEKISSDNEENNNPVVNNILKNFGGKVIQ